jgi:glucose/arabinose dehydrogenase
MTLRRSSALVLAAALAVAASVTVDAQRGGQRFRRVPALPFPAAPVVLDTLEGQMRIVPMVSGLENPWSIAFLPGGEMLVTEKPGRLRLVRNGQLVPEPIAGAPDVVARGQGGLLEVALHPQFATNQLIYLTYSKGGERGNTTALARGRLNGMVIEGLQDIFVADAWSERSGVHFGSKIAFGPDGKLYMTVGERGEGQPAQDLTVHKGKVLRLNDDGTVPADNPFAGRTDARAEIYSYGHRNMQGLAFHPVTGELWLTEHGPQGGDELNVIRPGRNYGWPVATYGREYSGVIITQQPYVEGMEPPVLALVPSLGLSGLVIYQGDAFPGWKGNFFLGGLSGLQIQRVGFTSEFLLIGMEEIAREIRQRIRDLREGPDGLLYVATDGSAGGILRIEPVAARRPVGPS